MPGEQTIAEANEDKYALSEIQKQQILAQHPGYYYHCSFAEPRDQWVGKYFSKDYGEIYICLEPMIVHLFLREA